MGNQKVLQNSQIKWFNEGNTRLNYQTIFNEPELETEENEYQEESADINQLLDERDVKWKRKLEQVRAEAYAEGLDAGRTEGIEQARSEIDQKFALISEAVDEANQKWEQRQEFLEPGLLDLAFEISESILGIPVENPAIRKTMEEKLSPLLQKMNEDVKPVLTISPDDLEWAETLKEDLLTTLTLNIQVADTCMPGEFLLESNEETLIHDFQEMLKDFKNTLALPSWK
jgi:flagellar biosynthesis/type III secretory pathway protein FliH